MRLGGGRVACGPAFADQERPGEDGARNEAANVSTVGDTAAVSPAAKEAQAADDLKYEPQADGGVAGHVDDDPQEQDRYLAVRVQQSFGEYIRDNHSTVLTNQNGFVLLLSGTVVALLCGLLSVRRPTAQSGV